MSTITKDGLFAEYLSEKMGVETYFSECGFISYKFNQDHIHIHEIFVKDDARKSGAGTHLLDYVKDLARKNGFGAITCNCQLHHDNASFSLERILQSGFKVVSDPRELTFVMELD